ncbi:circularly permuted type 2 ATP-grasp protein [Pseudomonas sp. SST3]|nr:circularly permuted type 2 ATP-grasp protein [Pseudomonas sp. SST3]NKQ13731.1 circularly permuted type 2 ATP-grasp protein [Pseudomonas sp. SST3]
MLVLEVPVQASSSRNCGTTAAALNEACFCVSLDQAALADALTEQLGDPELSELLKARCPHVFAARPVFVSSLRLRQVGEVIQAIERTVSLPAWREHALDSAPPIARHNPRGARSVFFGYDFHLDEDKLGLIEINTNAGGAMLNVLLARAQRSCCSGVVGLSPGQDGPGGFEQSILDMFAQEWSASGEQRPLKRVVILDESPQAQYLYPEFLLFQRLFESAGIDCIIADPADLAFHNDCLLIDGKPVDLVYNRLTDFYLEGDNCSALRSAYLADAVTVTPHPQAYALYADKRRLVDLTNARLLEEIGVDPQTRAALAHYVPLTVPVEHRNAEHLWDNRRSLFFKPVSGFGSRGAYRGEKLTKRVWEEIVGGNYVAQSLVVPGERRTVADPQVRAMKFDLRAYAYAGKVQWNAARVYQGQTTNFRTEGGGFAPVFTLREEEERAGSTERRSHASFTFLLDEAGAVEELPHPLYLALVRAERATSKLAGKRFRLADWYVAMEDGQPSKVIREWYGWVAFDTDGGYRPEADSPKNGQSESVGNVDSSALPTPEEHYRIEALLFQSE